MKRLILLLLITTSAISTAAVGGDVAHMDAAATLAISDKNNDNRIDREEYNVRMTEVFFMIDADKDGNLTISEIGEVEKIDPQRFEAADRDGTQTLSVYEYLNALHKDFETADMDKDGTIDLEELRNLMGQ